VCERQACGPGLNESCEIECSCRALTGPPRNALTLSDAPFAVGSRVRHLYVWAATSLRLGGRRARMRAAVLRG
jgi:hypothetical protein